MAKGYKTGGRKPGSLNKATKDIRDIAQGMLTDPDYVSALNARLKKGSAGAVEPLLFHYAYGKPVDTTQLIGSDGGPVRHVLQVIIQDKP